MPSYRLIRVVRTLSSEIYEAQDSGNRVAQIDVHYAGEVIYATVQIVQDIGEAGEQRLISQIDEEIVSSYLPSLARTDLIITVYRSEEIAHYSDILDNDEDIFEEYDNGKN